MIRSPESRPEKERGKFMEHFPKVKRVSTPSSTFMRIT